ncbi:MAG: glycosyltransferase family A protein [Terriglobia bacterium]
MNNVEVYSFHRVIINYPMQLSLLIPTLECRRVLFWRLVEGLEFQIRNAGRSSDVEILSYPDAGGRPIGDKRNILLGRAKGEFVAFIDDDDEVSERYIELIGDALERRPEVDCLGIRGVITFRGSHPREFVYSLQYSDMFSRNHTYYRPPAQWNPIRRAIAVRYPYPDVSCSEDLDWALRMRDDRALQREEFIDSVLCYYHSRRWWCCQWLLGGTEALRHKLGIRMVNRLRLRDSRTPPAEAASLGRGHEQYARD